MDLFFSNNWQNHYDKSITKSGLHLHFEKDIHPYIRTSLIYCASWLRTMYPFPVMLNVYCKRVHKVRCRDHSLAFGVIFQPYDRSYYPSVRLACDDYDPQIEADDEIIKESDLILFSFIHEIIHYYQYIQAVDMSEKGKERQATLRAKKLTNTYLNLCYGEEL